METAPIDHVIRELARADNTTPEALMQEAVRALLRERRRALQRDRLDVLRRYGVASAGALEEGVRSGGLGESPAWEDRIVLENLEEALARIDRELASL